MNIFDKNKKKSVEVDTTSTEVQNKEYTVKVNHKKYKVSADSQEDAEMKINNLLGIEPEKIEEKSELTINNILDDILKEIERIIKVAHPKVNENTYDRWIAVLTEELGEIVHEINDEFEGKKPTKNTYIECIQLASATILLANKFAKDHKEIKVR